MGLSTVVHSSSNPVIPYREAYCRLPLLRLGALCFLCIAQGGGYGLDKQLRLKGTFNTGRGTCICQALTNNCLIGIQITLVPSDPWIEKIFSLCVLSIRALTMLYTDTTDAGLHMGMVRQIQVMHLWNSNYTLKWHLRGTHKSIWDELSFMHKFKKQYVPTYALSTM